MYISFLPLAHGFERFMMHLGIANMLTIGFFQGDILKLREDLQVLKPTFMICVPRLLHKFHDSIQASIANLTGFKKLLAENAIKAKMENVSTKA